MNPRAPFDSKRFLVVDDEQEHIEFLPDFLMAKGFQVDIACNASDALRYAGTKKYRGYLIDLNIPLGGYHSDALSAVQKDYVGLRVIQLIRTQGVEGRRVVAYSAHENDTIKQEIGRLYCQYIVKGRVLDLKQYINRMIDWVEE